MSPSTIHLTHMDASLYHKDALNIYLKQYSVSKYNTVINILTKTQNSKTTSNIYEIFNFKPTTLVYNTQNNKTAHVTVF